MLIDFLLFLKLMVNIYNQNCGLFSCKDTDIIFLLSNFIVNQKCYSLSIGWFLDLLPTLIQTIESEYKNQLEQIK